jgi:hypothetical protein
MAKEEASSREREIDKAGDVPALHMYIYLGIKCTGHEPCRPFLADVKIDRHNTGITQD